jgi:acyl-CoA reductase-like NAD-dependent aldehyde dehydrogenase
MDIINPATGERLESVEADPPERVVDKTRAAQQAQRAWRKRSLPERAAIVAAFRQHVSAEHEDLARTLTLETGKPIAQSRNELRAFLGRIDFFLEHAPKVLAEEVVFDDDSIREVIAREPLGVVASISAWNYPYFVGGNVYVPALLAGNTVVYKPSELATLSGLHMARLWQRADLPEGCFTVALGGGDVGRELLEQHIDAAFFTGSYATGRRIATQLAGRMIPLQLELGGKDPAYVAEDVDLEQAAASVADGAFYNAGQSCCAVERAYVRREIFDQFVEHCVREAQKLTLGDPLDARTTLGPLARGQAQLDFLTEQIEDAKARGARVLCGGKRHASAGFYFEPTIVVDVDHSMRLMTEESFGPVLGVQAVESDEEALTLMRDTPYGLTAAVYTKDPERARALLEELPVGSAYQNCCDRVSPRLPWSGRGHSGLGTTLSLDGIRAMTVPKAWHLRT